MDVHRNVDRRYETVADVLEAASKPSSALTETLSATDPAAYRQFDGEFRKAVAIGLMDLADVLNDRSLSQTLLALDYDLYVETAMAAVAQNAYRTMNPFQALIVEYD